MTASIAERLLAQSEPADDGSGCLRWTGHRNPDGYGRMRVNGPTRSVHVLSHELWIGPIPEGYHVDHVRARGCRHRDCISPAHLEAVTPGENAYRARRDTCQRGHALTDDNLVERVASSGFEHRECRTCSTTRARAYYRRNGRKFTPLSADDPRHGTRNGYANFQCRCERCSAASTAYLADRKRARLLYDTAQRIRAAVADQ